MQNPKIILTEKCNLKCEYCFQESDYERNNEICVSDFELLLKWLKKQNLRKITVLGGEPSLHSRFEEILENIYKLSFSVNILSNLLFSVDVLKPYLSSITSICANITLIDSLKTEEKHMISDNLKKLEKAGVNTIICSTLYKRNQSFKSAIKLARDHKNVKSFRIDLARPSLNKLNTFIASSDINTFKLQILSIIEEIEGDGLSPIFDCPLPKCFFTKSEIEKYNLYSKGLEHNSCGDLFVINPDLSISACPFLRTSKKRVIEFISLIDAQDDLKEDLNLDVLKHSVFTYDKCQTCQYFFNNGCSGYCLAEKTQAVNNDYQELS